MELIEEQPDLFADLDEVDEPAPVADAPVVTVVPTVPVAPPPAPAAAQVLTVDQMIDLVEHILGSTGRDGRRGRTWQRLLHSVNPCDAARALNIRRHVRGCKCRLGGRGTRPLLGRNARSDHPKICSRAWSFRNTADAANYCVFRPLAAFAGQVV